MSVSQNPDLESPLLSRPRFLGPSDSNLPTGDFGVSPVVTGPSDSSPVLLPTGHRTSRLVQSHLHPSTTTSTEYGSWRNRTEDYLEPTPPSLTTERSVSGRHRSRLKVGVERLPSRNFKQRPNDLYPVLCEDRTPGVPRVFNPVSVVGVHQELVRYYGRNKGPG